MLDIEQVPNALVTVSHEAGFRDPRHLREVSLRHLGVASQAVLRSARGEPAAA